MVAAEEFAGQEMRVVCPSCHTTNQVPEERLQDGPRCGKCREALFGGGVLELSAATFQRHLERGDLPLLVDFWAPWCGPCKMMAPAFEQAAQQLEPNVRLAKVNTEEARNLGMKHGIQAIPTLVMFKQGREVARQPGAMQLPQIMQWVEMHA
jgi:thioredoxin 2